MNDPVIITSILALIGTLASGIINSVITNSVTKYRLEQLEKKVDKHNNVIDRTYNIEKRLDVLENELHHIEDDVK